MVSSFLVIHREERAPEVRIEADLVFVELVASAEVGGTGAMDENSGFAALASFDGPFDVVVVGVEELAVTG